MFLRRTAGWPIGGFGLIQALGLFAAVNLLGAVRVLADSAKPAQMQGYALHDSQPGINCDVAHLEIPVGWGVKGEVGWNLAVMMPGKWYVCAANLNGPELWVVYPGQAFIWRDNFNLLGVNFQLHAGDADPAFGDEIEQPVATATDCIKGVIIPRFRPDLAKAKVVWSIEMSAGDAVDFANKVVPDVMQQAQQIQIWPKEGMVLYQYSIGGKTVQEQFRLLVIYIDLPSSIGVVHVWCIPFCTSFRGQLGQGDEEIAFRIENSLKLDPAWTAKRDEVVKEASQLYGRRLQELAAAEESNIIANMNRNIFNMCQQSYHRRMDMEQQTFHNIDNAINGESDYVTPRGKVIQAAMTPLGQSAWQDASGQVKFFNNGVNPNGEGGGPYQQVTEK